MQTKINLPSKGINKIGIRRSTHLIVEINEHEFYNYEDYIDDDYIISFCKYITNLKDSYEVVNIKKVKNNSDNYLICTGCGNNIRFNDDYMINRFHIHCKHC